MSRWEAEWPSDAAAARALQAKLAPQVIVEGSAGHATLVAGVDVHMRGGRAIAVATLVELPVLEILETAVAEEPVRFPYVTGLLAFHELPAALAALAALGQLDTAPQAVLVDGHGLAHPRRFGIACHLGIELDVPTAGCAKSHLVGRYEDPGAEQGSEAPLTHGDERIAVVLRTRANVAPIFVSVGHRLSLAAAVDLVRRCGGRFRQPEPLRQAHLKARTLSHQ